MSRPRFRRSVVLGAAACLATAGAAALVGPTVASWADGAYLRSRASSAQVTDWKPWYGQVRLAGTQLCLDVPDRASANGIELQLYACNSTPAQIWAFRTDDSVRVYASVGQYAPDDNPVARCLRQNGNNNAATIDSCSNLQNRRWDIVAVTGGVQIRSVDTGRCLDVPSSQRDQGATVVTYSCTQGNRARVWLLEPVTTVVY